MPFELPSTLFSVLFVALPFLVIFAIAFSRMLSMRRLEILGLDIEDRVSAGQSLNHDLIAQYVTLSDNERTSIKCNVINSKLLRHDLLSSLISDHDKAHDCKYEVAEILLEAATKDSSVKLDLIDVLRKSDEYLLEIATEALTEADEGRYELMQILRELDRKFDQSI